MNQHDRRRLGRRAARPAALRHAGAALMRAGDEGAVLRVLAQSARDLSGAAFAAVIVRLARSRWLLLPKSYPPLLAGRRSHRRPRSSRKGEDPASWQPAGQPLVPAVLGVPLLASDGQVQGGLLVSLTAQAALASNAEIETS